MRNARPYHKQKTSITVARYRFMEIVFVDERTDFGDIAACRFQMILQAHIGTVQTLSVLGIVSFEIVCIVHTEIIEGIVQGKVIVIGMFIDGRQ